MKRILTSCIVVFLLVTAFLSAYSKGCYSYAEDINYMSDAELESAYQAYLQSKGGGLIGNAGARYTYMTGKMLNFLTSDSNTTPFKNINAVKGLMAWQKAELESGNSSVLQLAMSQGGASVFSLYTQWLLQNNYFGNGVNQTDGIFDNDIDNNLYQGKYYEGSLIWIIDNSTSNYFAISNSNWNKVKQTGTYYMYSNEYIVSNTPTTLTFNFIGSSLSTTLSSSYNANSYGGSYALDNTRISGNTASFSDIFGYPILVYNTYIDKYALCVYYENIRKTSNVLEKQIVDKYVLNFANDENINVSDVSINFYTNNNNNIIVYPDIDANGTLYITPKVDVGVNGEVNYQPYTINQGDTITNVVNNYYIDSGTPDKTITVPTDQPSGGEGGSGGGNDNPSGGTPPDWDNPYPNITQGSDGVWNFNFHLPNLNIDWNINGLKEKFPFSIPFDLIRFISVLNAEPETPEFDFTIDLRIYQWHIDADLHQFDGLAGIVRNVEFIGFCITLVLITRRMIKG